jgi:hypothetical protein
VELGLLGVSDRSKALFDTYTHDIENSMHGACCVVGALRDESILPTIVCGAHGYGIHRVVGLNDGVVERLEVVETRETGRVVV